MTGYNGSLVNVNRLMSAKFEIGDTVRETRQGAIQHDQWTWAGSAGKSRELKEGVIIRFVDRFLVGGRDALIRWSDGSESCRVATAEHLIKTSPPISRHSHAHSLQLPQIPSDNVSLKFYFAPGTRVVETRARCTRIQEGILGEIAIRRVGTVTKWKDDNVHVVVEWDRGYGSRGGLRRVLASKDEILRVEDSHEHDPEILHRLEKKSREKNLYTWTAWRVEHGFLAANSEAGSHTNAKRFNSLYRLKGFIAFLISVGYVEVESFSEDSEWQSYDDDQDYLEDSVSYVTEDQIARWEEMEDYRYWSGDPDWDDG